MTNSPLLSGLVHHSVPGDTYKTYVRPATDAELKSARKLEPGVRAPNFVSSKSNLVFVSNPILTDVTQQVNTDIRRIIQSYADADEQFGMSLILEDAAARRSRETVSLEDFIEPKQYVDIFDVEDFIGNAAKSFAQLPASFRKEFDNKASNLINALKTNEADTVSKLSRYLDIPSEVNSAAKAEVNSASETNKSISASSAPLPEVSKSVNDNSSK